MPSPFPGMDPFIEDQEWEDFHARLIPTLSEVLAPQVRPRYLVRVERRVYLEHPREGGPAFVRPDLLVVQPVAGRAAATQARGRRAGTTLEPVTLTVPMPEEQREVYLTIRARGTMEIVTVIEALSPANKRSGSDGRREYINKREEVLRSA